MLRVSLFAHVSFLEPKNLGGLSVTLSARDAAYFLIIEALNRTFLQYPGVQYDKELFS